MWPERTSMSLPQRTAPGEAWVKETRKRQTPRASKILRIGSPLTVDLNKRGYIARARFGNCDAIGGSGVGGDAKSGFLAALGMTIWEGTGDYCDSLGWGARERT